ncbi:Skp-like protein [Chlamydiales bacterium SCGC AG-110-M15]|nr:Skp-like protein [Chlamydiales bacterium SCGC AG-110-M15]
MKFINSRSKTKVAALFAAAVFTFSSSFADEAMDQLPQAPSIGVVNVRQCIENSKLGLQGREILTKTQKQMDEVLAKMNDELKDVSEKFSDEDYLDSLAPELEKELRTKLMSLSQEKSQFENQYYQIMNQANTQFIQSILSGIGRASESVAATRDLEVIVDSETCFFYRPAIDLTTAVLEEMNTLFDENEEKIEESKEVVE